MSERNEIERLHSEANLLRSEMSQARAEMQQHKLETRQLPPMSQMTRIQKRYFLEPWWTVGWVGSWALTVPSFIAAIFTWFHLEFALLGSLFLLTGAAFATAKLFVAEWNQETEGKIAGTNSNGHGTSCRCARCY